MNIVLANSKTKEESGLNFVMESLEIMTPFGKKILKEKKPFLPGQEKELRDELSKIQSLYELYEKDRDTCRKLKMDGFMCVDDPTQSIKRAHTEVLSVVELFEIKGLLLTMRAIHQYIDETKVSIPEEFIPHDVEKIIDILDPRGDRINTFYIYEDFSPKLLELRENRRNIERQLRREQKKLRDIIRKEYGVELTPKFECATAKTDEARLQLLESIDLLEPLEQDYLNITFTLKKTDETYSFIKEMEAINASIEEEELEVMKNLSLELSKHEKTILENCHRIGLLELNLSKAEFAFNNNCVRPEIIEEHGIYFEDGRHLKVENVLKRKGKNYIPISVNLSQGVTCITGANMGGKTISLKLFGLISLMTQYGFFVPCKFAKVGLSNYIQMLIGDSQSVERGLSSFGSEMEELKEILDKSRDRSVILIDEIASGTNPTEGFALSRSLVDYLMDKPYISVITTHFEAVYNKGINNLEVVGLANADFNNLSREIKYANRKQRIEIIGKYMDYRLCQAKEGGSIPKDALNIALMLGIDEDIIKKAKEYLS